MHVRCCRAILEMNNESVANGTGIDMVATYTCSPGYAFTGQQDFFLCVFISFDHDKNLCNFMCRCSSCQPQPSSGPAVFWYKLLDINRIFIFVFIPSHALGYLFYYPTFLKECTLINRSYCMFEVILIVWKYQAIHRLFWFCHTFPNNILLLGYLEKIQIYYFPLWAENSSPTVLTKRKTYECLSVQIVVLTWNRQWGT